MSPPAESARAEAMALLPCPFPLQQMPACADLNEAALAARKHEQGGCYACAHRSAITAAFEEYELRIEELEQYGKKTTQGAIRFIDSSLCDEHKGRVRMQSPGEFLADHLGKCLLCIERDRDSLKARVEELEREVAESNADAATYQKEAGRQAGQALERGAECCRLAREREELVAALDRIARWDLADPPATRSIWMRELARAALDSLQPKERSE